MKIAYVTDAIYPFTIGGSEIRNYEIAKRLIKKGHEVHIYGAKLWNGPSVKNQEGIILHGLCPFPRGLYGKNGKRLLWKPFLLSLKIAREILMNDYDIVDNAAFNFFNCYATKVVSFFKKFSLVFVWHQYFGDYLKNYFGEVKGKIAESTESSTARFADFNIACSHQVRDSLEKAGVKQLKIKVLYNGSSFDEALGAKPFREKYDLIFAGRMNYQKNPLLFAETVKELKSRFPGIKAVMIGGGPELDGIKRYAGKNGLGNNLLFKGEIHDRKELFSYIKSSKIFVLTSRFEGGIPLVVLESYACGTPVVSTDYAGGNIRGLIQDKHLVSGASCKEISLKITKLLKNKGKLKKIGGECKKEAGRFDWGRVAEETEYLYRKLLSGSRDEKTKHAAS